MFSHPLAVARLALLVPLIWLLTEGGRFHYWAGLVVFLICGLGSLIEGYLPRKTPPTRAGAMLDAMAERLLTIVVVAGLIASGMRSGLVLVASLILIARDVVVASINEALPQQQLDIRPAGLEKGRIAFQILGFGFLIAPAFPLPDTMVSSRILGGVALIVAGILAVITLVGYGRRAARAFKSQA